MDSSSSCKAIGGYEDLSGTVVPFAESWNGRSWDLEQLPTVTAIASELFGISCTSTKFCEAAGFWQNDSGFVYSLDETFDGSSWKVQATPNPQGSTDSYVNGLACRTETFCKFVGYWTVHTLGEAWNGSHWTVQAPANPSQKIAVLGRLNGVACSTTPICAAVGTYEARSTSQDTPLAEIWTGKVWVLTQVPTPSN
jgi:hypothetical protein